MKHYVLLKLNPGADVVAVQQRIRKTYDKLRNDKRMPQTINYLERYNALLKMDDRSEVLRRLDQTIAKAEAIIAEAEKVDVDAVIDAVEESFKMKKDTLAFYRNYFRDNANRIYLPEGDYTFFDGVFRGVLTEGSLRTAAFFPPAIFSIASCSF